MYSVNESLFFTHLVHVVAQLLQLIHSVLGLQVRVVSGSYGSHRSWLVTRVRLGGVLEVRVRPSRTVDANVASHVNVRTAVGLAHDGHNGDPASRAHRLGSGQWREMTRIGLFH